MFRDLPWSPKDNFKEVDRSAPNCLEKKNVPLEL